MQQRYRAVSVGAAALSVFLVGLPAWATGPSNQVLANPSGSTTLNSVVQLSAFVGGVNDTQGSGSVVDVFTTAAGVGFFTVLTADHVVPAVNSMAFLNNGAGGFRAFAIQSFIRTVGKNATDTPDMALAIVRYGAPDAFFNNYLAGTNNAKLSLVGAGGIAIGDNFSDVGFGLTGTIAANVLTVTAADTSGTKRYQNNAVTARPFIVNGPYSYQGVEAQFNSPGGVAGEGGTFGADSGSPYLSSSATFDPGGGLPVVRVDNIAAVHTLGKNVYNNGDTFDGVDVGTYRADILTAIGTARVLASAPEPGSLSLLALALVGGLVTHRRRRAR